MNRIRLLAGMALLATALGAAAHNVEHHSEGPVRKEQKAWGIAGDAKAAKRTIELTMSDTMRFTPDVIRVRQGETVRIVLKNGGQVLHEMVMGTRQELEEHAALMARFPNMEHDEPYMAHVKPGARGEIVWTFNRAGSFDFACLIPGHYQAGMVGKIEVTPATATSGAGPAVAPELTAGEVRKVDTELNKLTLRHEPIANLEMPAMTMVFHVASPEFLKNLKPGDKVRFHAESTDGNLVVTRIQQAE